MAELGETKHTERGFEIVEFRDCYNVPCQLQASSLAVYEKPGTSAVWLGVADAQPKILASQAAGLNVATREVCGWVPYPIPEEVSLNTRMHLDREHVEALIGHLQRWLKTDTFAENADG